MSKYGAKVKMTDDLTNSEFEQIENAANRGKDMISLVRCCENFTALRRMYRQLGRAIQDAEIKRRRDVEDGVEYDH